MNRFNVCSWFRCRVREILRRMKEYLHLIGKRLLPFVVGAVAAAHSSYVRAEEYIPSFVKQVNEDKREKYTGLVSEGKTLEQCMVEMNEQEHRPQVMCRVKLNEYRMPASGLRGLIGRSQMKLKESELVEIRKPERTYGRQELVDVINYSACVMKEVYDVPLVVHDLSREGGGRLRPHKSHHNGRDVDVGIYGYDVVEGRYYNATTKMKKRGGLHPDFNNTQALDANWLFIDSVVRGPFEVEMIFLDQKLINGLRSYVVGKYGMQRWNEVGGVLRHEPGHSTHYHIRTKVVSPTDVPRT